MKKEDKQALGTVFVTILIGALVALAGSQGSVRFSGLPVFAVSVTLAYVIQWIVFIPSYINRTEHFFDLTGGITYTVVSVLSIVLSGKMDMRSIVLIILVLTWAIRLSSFLFMRVRKAGEDRRFREIKQSFWRFLQTWTLRLCTASFITEDAFASRLLQLV